MLTSHVSTCHVFSLAFPPVLEIKAMFNIMSENKGHPSIHCAIMFTMFPPLKLLSCWFHHVSSTIFSLKPAFFLLALKCEVESPTPPAKSSKKPLFPPLSTIYPLKTTHLPSPKPPTAAGHGPTLATARRGRRVCCRTALSLCP